MIIGIILTLGTIGALIGILLNYFGIVQDYKIVFFSIGIVILALVIPQYYQSINTAINLDALMKDSTCIGYSCSLKYLGCQNKKDVKECLDSIKTESQCGKLTIIPSPACLQEGMLSIVYSLIKGVAGMLPSSLTMYTIDSSLIISIVGSSLLLISCGVAMSVATIFVMFRWIGKLLVDYKNADLVTEFKIGFLMPLQIVVTPLLSMVLIVGFDLIIRQLIEKLKINGYIDFIGIVVNNDVNGITLPLGVVIIILAKIILYFKIAIWTAKIIQYLIFAPIGAVLSGVSSGEFNVATSGISTYCLAIILACLTETVMNACLIITPNVTTGFFVGIGLALCAITSDTIVKEYFSGSQAPSIQSAGSAAIRLGKLFGTKK